MVGLQADTTMPNQSAEDGSQGFGHTWQATLPTKLYLQIGLGGTSKPLLLFLQGCGGRFLQSPNLVYRTSLVQDSQGYAKKSVPPPRGGGITITLYGVFTNLEIKR